VSDRRAVVLLSGGMDSTTVLAIARRDGYACHTLAFDYGQRHDAELAAAAAIAAAAGVTSHRVLRLDLGVFGGSALTDASIEVPAAGGEGIPVTYVPARNTVFLACGLALAETVGARKIFIGVNAVDYSGYPDCRPAFIEAFERLANLATKAGVEGAHITIAAPLLHSSKAEIVRIGTELGVDHSMTVSCYEADTEGKACGACDACVLRREGFRSAGVPDPTRYR
jgi:7-cyano-7-deazaguanine synthase